jgi:hypothetical protein
VCRESQGTEANRTCLGVPLADSWSGQTKVRFALAGCGSGGVYGGEVEITGYEIEPIVPPKLG